MHETEPNLDEPLDDAELDELDRFLLERVDEDVWCEGMDEGTFCVSALDGFFTALVSGPVTLMPSAWLPAAWGDFEPSWRDEAEFERIFLLMVRHVNSIALHLMAEPETFEPLFVETRADDGGTATVVDEWCEGYRRGVELAASEWEAGGDEVLELLEPILAFTEAEACPAYELPRGELEQLQRAIAPCVRALHARWVEQRADVVPAPRPVRRAGPEVGRNDPCPCGSGRKYKKCCLH